MNNLLKHFEVGFLHHGDLAETMRVFYRSRAELKSDDRDQFTKKTGRNKKEYEV